MKKIADTLQSQIDEVSEAYVFSDDFDVRLLIEELFEDSASIKGVNIHNIEDALGQCYEYVINSWNEKETLEQFLERVYPDRPYLRNLIAVMSEIAQSNEAQ